VRNYHNELNLLRIIDSTKRKRGTYRKRKGHSTGNRKIEEDWE
jgi:hypothetical protein